MYKFMKKNPFASFSEGIMGHKLILKMKLTILILMGCLMQVSATVYSQVTKFSFDIESKQVVDVLKEIEEKSDFRFFYQREQVDVTRKVDLKVTGQSVEAILGELFKDQEITFNVLQNNLIVLAPKGEKFASVATQQEKKITGKVSDATGATLPGVSVVVKGTTIGVISDIDGKFSLSNIPDNATLVFSFVGMKTREITVAGKTTANIVMEEETIGLEEVVAIGYGSIKKSDVTGAVATVSQKDLTAYPATSVVQSMQGRSAGVMIQATNGEPGEDFKITIRGATSINASSAPLFVVDGLVGGSMPPSEDIAAIEIL